MPFSSQICPTSVKSPWLWKRSVIHQRLTPRNQALRIESRSTLNGAARPSFKMAGKGRTCWRDYLKLNLNFQPSSLEKVYTKWLTYLSGLSTAACKSGTCWYYFSNANNILIKSRMLLFQCSHQAAALRDSRKKNWNGALKPRRCAR